MSGPVRIQRKRTRGWKMPPNTVFVGRPTKWGNPHKVAKPYQIAGGEFLCETADEAVRRYRAAWERTIRSADTHPRHPYMPFGKPVFLGPLRGKNLACWCPLDQPCHADVLLELANPAPPVEGE